MAQIFSTYSTGENRVTASVLAVLGSLALSRTQRLLGAMLEQAEFELVRFQNQPSMGGSGVPDAMILASCRLLIETKTVREAVNVSQIKRHLQRLHEATEINQILLVLTPDNSRPSRLSKLEDPRLAWSSFATFDQAIDELLSDPREVVSEREAFLLRELQAMFEAEKLLESPMDTVVVAARSAWPEYNDFHAYVCQPNRAFRQVTRMGFYSNQRIFDKVPEILEMYEEVPMKLNLHKGALGKTVNYIVANSLRLTDEIYKVILLSPPDSAKTLTIPNNGIQNDKKDRSGKTTAFTMGQRYVASSNLLTANRTSDLDDQ